MGFLRDLWNDPDPIKWVIFGGAAASVLAGGALLIQTSTLNATKESLATVLAKPKGPAAPAPRGSLQEIADKAHEVGQYARQVKEDQLLSNIDNPTQYIQQMAAYAKLGDLTIQPTQGGGGQTYKDTSFNVVPPRDRAVPRENLKIFLYNIQTMSALMTVTSIHLFPFGGNHRPGMTLGQTEEDEKWMFDARFTIRQRKTEVPAR